MMPPLNHDDSQFGKFALGGRGKHLPENKLKTQAILVFAFEPCVKLANSLRPTGNTFELWYVPRDALLPKLVKHKDSSSSASQHFNYHAHSKWLGTKW